MENTNTKGSTWLSDSQIAMALMRECDRAQKLHPEWPADIIYQAVIINEEAGEVMKACMEYRFEPAKGVTMAHIIAEVVQVGAMAVRFLKNVPEIGKYLGETDDNAI